MESVKFNTKQPRQTRAKILETALLSLINFTSKRLRKDGVDPESIAEIYEAKEAIAGIKVKSKGAKKEVIELLGLMKEEILSPGSTPVSDLLPRVDAALERYRKQVEAGTANLAKQTASRLQIKDAVAE